MAMSSPRHIHFVTGRLAAEALRAQVESLAQSVGFGYSIEVLPISVAALMTTSWIARHLHVPNQATDVMLPGYCEGELESLAEQLQRPVTRGPRDLHELARHFNQSAARDYGAWSIQILAEINHATRLSIDELVEIANRLRADGADVIDVGCVPGAPSARIGDQVRALKDAGHRVSIDSFDPQEISAACRAGAELVLSVNHTNREQAVDWGTEVVAIPDDVRTCGGLDTTIARLAQHGVPFRLDPILEPIGCGFAASLGRFLNTRERYPELPMMMGIGNLTELTDCDSAAVNVLLMGFCQELRIDSILTTQVIPWAQTSVRECALARQLVHYAVRQGTIPKHVEPGLVMLRDPAVVETGVREMQELATQITDRNFRLFADSRELHVVSRQLYLSDDDPFRLFDRLLSECPETIDPGHAFYLGFELAKASIARTLGKSYRQDEALDWGLLTQPEDFHRLRRKWRAARPGGGTDDDA